MARYNRLVQLVLGAALWAPVTVGGATACGPGTPPVLKAVLKPGNMPSGGEWHGVYYDQTFGYLHVLKDGDAVNAKWRTAAGDKWGEMHGKVQGDIYRYDWAEHLIGMYGPNATTSGKGYFRYTIPKGENVDHELLGEWGLGQSDSGNPWNAIKQRNMKPEPESVMPDEHQTTVVGGDWDSNERSEQSSGIDPDEDLPPAEGEEGAESEGEKEAESEGKE